LYPAELVELASLLVRACPDAVFATMSVITPAPTTAAIASEWLTRDRRLSAASRLACARVRMFRLR
jgi:hypothetical protein